MPIGARSLATVVTLAVTAATPLTLPTANAEPTPVTARWSLQGFGEIDFGRSAPKGKWFEVDATDASGALSTCSTRQSGCQLQNLAVDQEYAWRAYEVTGNGYTQSVRTLIGEGRSVLSRSLPTVVVAPKSKAIRVSLAVADAALADRTLTLRASLGGWRECSTSVADDPGCEIWGLRNGKTYSLTVSATHDYTDWPLLEAVPTTPTPPTGRPGLRMASSRLRANNQTRKAVFWTRVATKFREVTIVSRTVKAWRGRALYARGSKRISLSPGKYRVMVKVRYRDGQRRRVLKKHKRVRVLPARMPLGAQRSLNLLMYSNGELAYFFGPGGGSPMVGGNAELVRWPSHVSLSQEYRYGFSNLKWKSWTSARSYARGTMYDGRKGKPATLVLDSPQTLVCRSDRDYSDVVRVRTFQRFGWVGGYKHINPDGRWMTENEWQWLRSPSAVYRNGETYEC